MRWDTVRAMIRDEVEASSQAMVAEAFGVSPSTLSRWVRGERAPLGPARVKVMQWARSRQAHAEPPPQPLPAVMQGQAVEIEALLAYALERQQRLTESMRSFNAAAAEAVAR
jgi:transposase-like protein